MMGASARGRCVLLLALGLGIALIWGGAALLARAGHSPVLVYDGAFAVAFALYAVAAVLVLRPRPGGALGRVVVPGILLLALLPRVLLLTTEPTLSHDVHRYIWEGKLINGGVSPYRYPPDAPELVGFRDAQWQRVGYPWMPSPYPPGAQLVFAVTYRLAPGSIKAQQVRAVATDLLVIAALLLLLGRLGLPRRRVLIYAWHPGPVLHFAHAAHLDALMLAALLLALALIAGRAGAGARAGSGAMLALAGLLKLVPLVAAPLLVRRWGWPGTVVAALVLLPGLTPYWLTDGARAALMAESAETFNDSLHYLLVKILATVTPAYGAAATAVTAVVWSGAAAGLAWRGGPPAVLARGVAALLGLMLLTNAIVMPWYLTWLLPFVALFLRPGRGKWPLAPTPLAGWLWLSLAVQLTDLYLVDIGAGRWFWFWPIKAVEYGPLFACLAWAAAPVLRRAIAHYHELLARRIGAAPAWGHPDGPPRMADRDKVARAAPAPVEDHPAPRRGA